jgi:LysM repeat protein
MKPMKTKSTRRLRARAVAVNQHTSEYDDYGPEPNMKLSHAFLVVLLLHVIAVGAIYAFTTMKASKAPKFTVATAGPTEPTLGGSGSSNQPGQQEDPKNRPPSNSKPPLVAKTSSASKPTENTADGMGSKVAENAKPHQGIISALKAAILRLSGIGASTAGVATASAQEITSQTTPQVTTTSSLPADSTTAPSTSATPKTYVVKAGDTITRIASSLGVTILELEKANGLAGNSILRVGEILKVPEKGVAQAAGDNAVQSTQAPSVAPQSPGTIASTIASATTSAPASANGGAGTPVDTTGMTEYTVAKGDNPYKIAKKFKIKPDDLMKVNNITDPKKIQIGQKLKIPASAKKASQKAPVAQ